MHLPISIATIAIMAVNVALLVLIFIKLKRVALHFYVPRQHEPVPRFPNKHRHMKVRRK